MSAKKAHDDVPRIALTKGEAAQALGVSEEFFDAHIAREIRTVRVGSLRIVPVKQIDYWLRELSDYAYTYRHRGGDDVPSMLAFRRARESAPRKRAYIPSWVREAVYDRDDWRCLHCGSEENLSIDHIKPWSLGGPDTLRNFQTLCRSCNSRKGAKVAYA